MLQKRTDRNQQTAWMPQAISERRNLESHRGTGHQEGIYAALALLLGPETDYHVRVNASRKLARQGAKILPILLQTLSAHPEITTPAWPWWPPQYEHCSRLLLHLCREANLTLESVLQESATTLPAGPLLWISIIEALALQSDEPYEALLCKALTTPWETVRYSAAMTLAKLAERSVLQETTCTALLHCTKEHEPIPLQLAASYALLRNQDRRGAEVYIRLLDPETAAEARKAAVFVLAMETPTCLSHAQHKRLTELLILTLKDQNEEIALHAAHALRSFASLSTLDVLSRLLETAPDQMKIPVLVALEEIASRNVMRRVIQQKAISARIVPLLRHENKEIRRQACFTLATLGGDYATVVLGTTLMNREHPALIEAIETLRLLRGVLRGNTRLKVVRWLLEVLQQEQEEVLVTALDSLMALFWEAHSRRQRAARLAISAEIIQSGMVFQLLSHSSAWVRQRAIELQSAIGDRSQGFQYRLLCLLHADPDSGVRACIAYTLGQLATVDAIPDLLQALLDLDEQVAETALNALSVLATPDNAIVRYVIEELSQAGISPEGTKGHLALAASSLLKKWQKDR